jgi:hypothetical protein
VQFIETELEKKFDLSIKRRKEHFMTVAHFVVLERHRWQKTGTSTGILEPSSKIKALP